MTNNDELALKLKAAAEKATVLNLETAQIERGNDGYYECPVCCGLGEVEAETDFCNIDGVALGVQFYGIGEHHGAAEEYFRTVAPANVLALLAERDADKKRIADLEIKIQRQKDKLQRMASKTITIGLKPMRIEGGAYCSAHAYYDKNGEYLSLDDVEKKCAAAGIKLEVGE